MQKSSRTLEAEGTAEKAQQPVAPAEPRGPVIETKHHELRRRTCMRPRHRTRLLRAELLADVACVLSHESVVPPFAEPAVADELGLLANLPIILPS